MLARIVGRSASVRMTLTTTVNSFEFTGIAAASESVQRGYLSL